MKKFCLAASALCFFFPAVSSSSAEDLHSVSDDSGIGVRSDILLEKGWKFHLGEVQPGEELGLIESGTAPAAVSVTFDDSSWEQVTVPHDWAITGPFDRENDLQNVAVTQNFETKASLKTGRTGGLPYVGAGWYRTEFTVPEGKRATLIFGYMSTARQCASGRMATALFIAMSPTA